MSLKEKEKDEDYESREYLINGKNIKVKIPKRLIATKDNPDGVIACKGAKTIGVIPGFGKLPEIPDI